MLPFTIFYNRVILTAHHYHARLAIRCVQRSAQPRSQKHFVSCATLATHHAPRTMPCQRTHPVARARRPLVLPGGQCHRMPDGIFAARLRSENQRQDAKVGLTETDVEARVGADLAADRDSHYIIAATFGRQSRAHIFVGPSHASTLLHPHFRCASMPRRPRNTQATRFHKSACRQRLKRRRVSRVSRCRVSADG